MGQAIEITFSVGPFPIAGQLEFPENRVLPVPSVLIVPGPPQHDRYGNVRGYPGYNNYFQPLSEQILHAGYAVFRYDKGGTGKSSSGLSAPENMVEAYRKMCYMDGVDRSKISILAIGGGSAFVYRKWIELEEINPVHQLTLLSTGVNDLKLEQLSLPICLIAGEGGLLRSERALDKYQKKTGYRTMIYEAEGANEQLCKNDKNQASLFKEGGCEWHEGALEAVYSWFSSFTEDE